MSEAGNLNMNGMNKFLKRLEKLLTYLNEIQGGELLT